MITLPPPPQLGPAVHYIHVICLAACADEPQEYYDELDAERWTRRCVRRFRNGQLAAYSYRSNNWRDVMPEAAMPLASEIDKDTQFRARDISQDEFEAVWAEAQTAARDRWQQQR